jgi:hypothetical protein
MQVRINCNDLWPWLRVLVAVQHVLLHSLSCNRKRIQKKMHKGHTSNAVKVTALQAGQSSRQQGQVLGTLYAKPFLMANNSVP